MRFLRISGKKPIRKGTTMSFDFASVHGEYLPFIRLAVSSYPERYREDLTQEGLWGLYLGCCAYDPARAVPFDAYIKVCIRNRISTAARRFASDYKLVPLEDADRVLSEGSSMEDTYARAHAVREALQDLRPRLSELEQKVLTLYLSGFSGAGIADRLGISAKSADNAMTRIKKKIRDHLPD